MLSVGRGFAAAAVVLTSSVTSAQEIPTPGSCSGKNAAIYADGKSFRLWVLRRGSLQVNDPLRPLSRDAFVVLQIVVNGRTATAYWRDIAHLRRGGPPAKLEEESGDVIRWESRIDELPASLRIVAEDGRVVFDRLAFTGCEEPPAARAPARATPEGSRKPAGDAAKPARPPVALPQGAIP